MAGSLAAFLAARDVPVRTGVSHPPVTLGFRIDGPDATSFTVRLGEDRAVLDRHGTAADHWVTCSQAEFEDLLAGRKELLGPFWNEHLPLRFEWAPSLYGFLFADRPYLDAHPGLRELYTTPRFYPTVTPYPQGYRLHALVLDEQLGNTLEVGLAYGGSALYICAAHAIAGEGHHIALDPFQELFFDGEGVQFVERAGLGGYFTWLPTRAQAALPALARAGFRFDLIYIDGDHSVPAVLSDFLQADALLRSGAYLAFDDSHLPSGQRALRTITRHFRYETVTERTTDRLTILRKSGHVSGPAAIRLAAIGGRLALAVLERRRTRRSLEAKAVL